MSEEPEVYTATPTILGTKFRSNPNYESVRQGVIALLNSYDPSDSIIDNRETVTKEAISLLEKEVEDARELLAEYKRHDLSLTTIDAEGYLRGCITCIQHLKDYL